MKLLMLRHSSRMRELNDSPRPVGHCTTSQFRSIVTPQHSGIDTTHGGETVEFADQMLAGDAAINHPAEALAGVLIDDGHDLDRSPVGGDVDSLDGLDSLDDEDDDGRPVTTSARRSTSTVTVTSTSTSSWKKGYFRTARSPSRRPPEWLNSRGAQEMR